MVQEAETEGLSVLWRPTGTLPEQSCTGRDFIPFSLSILFFLNLKNFLFSYNCLHFLPFPPPTPANPTSLPDLYSPPWFCPCVLYSSSCRPFSPLSPPHSPLAIVTLFLISMSLVIFCLLFSFVDYVPVKGEITALSRTRSFPIHFNLDFCFFPVSFIQNTLEKQIYN